MFLLQVEDDPKAGIRWSNWTLVPMPEFILTAHLFGAEPLG